MAHEQAKAKDVEMKDAAPAKEAKEAKVLTPEEKAKEALALLHAGAWDRAVCAGVLGAHSRCRPQAAAERHR